MLPREFDPNTFQDASNEVDMAVNRAKGTASDLGKAPGDLTIKKDDGCPRWTIKHTKMLICLVAATAFVIWAAERAW